MKQLGPILTFEQKMAKLRACGDEARKRSEQQAAAAQVEKAERQHRMIVQLPLWADEIRAQPNEACRAALFTVRRARKRKNFLDEQIFVLGGGSISYTGFELRAENDELVWLQILHYAKMLPLGRWVEFTPYQICQDIGWTPSGPNYKLIRECLLRLKATALTIESKRLKGGLALSLIGDFLWRGEDGKPRTKYAVQVPTEVREWFGEDNFTRLNWEIYRTLPPVERRLYDYVASHREPYALKAETIYELCGSDAKSLVIFRKILRRAVKSLDQRGLLKKVDITFAGLVKFTR